MIGADWNHIEGEILFLAVPKLRLGERSQYKHLLRISPLELGETKLGFAK